MYDSITSMNENIVNSYISEGKVTLDAVEVVESLSLEEYNKIMKKLDFSNTSEIIIKNDK